MYLENPIALPAADVRSPDGERILILLANKENRSLLGGLLSQRYAVSDELAAPGEVDLCIVDGPSLSRNWHALLRARAVAEPLLFPILLLSDRRDVRLVTRDLWRVVDDVLFRPVEKLELRARIETMLRARRLSVQLARMASLYEHERRVAHRLQEAALPHALPEIAGLELTAFYRPGMDEAQIGGDWYDALAVADGRIILTIGDVSGSGLEAAVTMANVRQVLRGVAHIHPDPAMMLEAADRTLQSEQPDRLVTAFVAVFDSVTSLLTYASAGHCRPIVRRAGGRVEELTQTGMLLGLPGRIERESATVALEPGATLVLYTDGITEATHDVDEGESRLSAALCDRSVLAAPNLAEAIHDYVLPYGSRDDVALLTARVEARSLDDSLLRWTFDVRDAITAQRARREFAAELKRRGASADDRFVAELVFGELIGNVVRHAPGIAEVTLDFGGNSPVLHVLDGGPGFRHVAKLPSDLFSERGRGLFLIASLTHEFSVSPRLSGGSHARVVLSMIGSRASLIR